MIKSAFELAVVPVPVRILLFEEAQPGSRPHFFPAIRAGVGGSGRQQSPRQIWRRRQRHANGDSVTVTCPVGIEKQVRL
jgi:hypothetical protein